MGHPFQSSRPVDAVPAGAPGNESPAGGLYLHLPFCRTICPYCDFAVRRDQPSEHAGYLAALQQSWAEDPEPLQARTIYLGGGTPSRMAADGLARLLAATQARFTGGGSPLELTLEANPEDLDEARLQAWRAAGVDRLSIGLQRLDAGHLRRLGRARSAAALAALPDLLTLWRDLGGACSLDLIYGLPAESPDAWQRELETVLTWPVEHLSTYVLSVESGTPLARAVARGLLVPADDPVVEDCHTRLHAVLALAGWESYEVSNHCLPGRRARHNTAYWQGLPYLGFGLGAASFLPSPDGTGLRFSRSRDWDTWLRAPGARVELESLGSGERQLEQALLGLRSVVGVPAEWLAVWRRQAPADLVRLDAAGGLVPADLPGRFTLASSARMLADFWALRLVSALESAGFRGVDRAPVAVLE